MRLPWRREAIHAQPRPVITKQLELEAAKAILCEVFRVRAAEVDDMLMKRLQERNCSDGREDGQWPVEFSLVE